MKVNYIGIIGGILAFISLALPWWTLSLSGTYMGITATIDLSLYLYKVTASAMGFAMDMPFTSWYNLLCLALVIIGGILGIIGSIILVKGKRVLVIGGLLALISIIMFAVGLQIGLSTGYSYGTISIPPIPLFGSGTLSMMGITYNYTCYLSFGFWIALVASILMFAASKKAEAIPPPPPPTTAPAPPPT